ncbi:MAG: hypothetical protein AAGC62_08950 [Pseudomonadota bacterium]
MIEDRPWLLGLCLASATIGATALVFHAWDEGSATLGFAAVLFGIGAIWSLHKAIRHTRLTLRDDGTATLAVRDRLGWSTRDFSSGELRAGLETQRDGDGDTQRAVLLVDGPEGVERLPLTAYLTSGSRHEAAVARINAWSARSQPRRSA